MQALAHSLTNCHACGSDLVQNHTWTQLAVDREVVWRSCPECGCRATLDLPTTLADALRERDARFDWQIHEMIDALPTGELTVPLRLRTKLP